MPRNSEEAKQRHREEKRERRAKEREAKGAAARKEEERKAKRRAKAKEFRARVKQAKMEEAAASEAMVPATSNQRSLTQHGSHRGLLTPEDLFAIGAGLASRMSGNDGHTTINFVNGNQNHTSTSVAGDQNIHQTGPETMEALSRIEVKQDKLEAKQDKLEAKQDKLLSKQHDNEQNILKAVQESAVKATRTNTSMLSPTNTSTSSPVWRHLERHFKNESPLHMDAAVSKKENVSPRMDSVRGEEEKPAEVPKDSTTVSAMTNVAAPPFIPPVYKVVAIAPLPMDFAARPRDERTAPPFAVGRFPMSLSIPVHDVEHLSRNLWNPVHLE